MRIRVRGGRSSRKRNFWVGVAVLVVLVGLFNLDGDDTPSSSSLAATATGDPTPDPVQPSSPAPQPRASQAPVSQVADHPQVGETVVVTRVIDGDTFELADGRTVRVLGIDSCEMDTHGGEEAKHAAESSLDNPDGPINITAEPGVDVDRYGRLLRYVQVDGEDFGEVMVPYDHTGVYQGENDASPEYVARLYQLDTKYAANPPAGRDCSGPQPAPVPDYDDGDDFDFNGRDGDLTGGFCRGKWWC